MFRLYSILGAILAAGAYAQTFDWSSIQPSKKFSWISCYSGLECARFSVPLNYSDSSQGDAAIAMIRIKSNFTGSDYLGPIFLGPGGPGGSGVETILSPLAQGIASNMPQFDFVSFDPRGVSHSTPAIKFFTSDAEQALWLSTQISDSNSSSDALARQVAQAKLLGQLAKDRDNGILAHVTTDNVARDVLQMVEAYGGHDVKFWGVSYGTVIGATFASMFPDRISRMLLDGVVDTIEYYKSILLINLQDSDTDMQHFFNACFTAGPSKCAFHNNASSPDEIASNLDALYSSIRTQPLPAYTGPNAGYGIVDYDYLHGVVAESLYTPYASFAPLASALETLKRGNTTEIFALSTQTFTPPAMNIGLCKASGSGTFPSADAREAGIAIQCSDWGIIEDSLDDLQALLVSGNSTFFGEELQFRVGCIGWQYHPQHFSGPIGANTSFPLMLIGNTADFITPISGARKISQVFPGSVVLQQNSLGHTSTAASSNCTLMAIRAYFVNGTLPQPDTVCEVESELFPGSGIHI